MSDSSFGHWLRLRRKALDYTQEQLANLVGCAPETLRKIEADRRRPSQQIAERLADNLAIAPPERRAFLLLARGEARTHVPAPPAPSTPGLHPPLPAPSHALIGREIEIAAVCERLQRPDLRLLTLVGVGGTGKTRLALEVARQLEGAFADGVFFVSLATLTTPDGIPQAIALAVGACESNARPPLEAVIARLQGKHALLVLDNYEHMLSAAPLVTELLTACAQLTVLVTSRVALRVYGEHEWPLAPLAVPPPTAATPETIAGYGAVALFGERIRAVKPDWSLTAANAPTVAAICARLDGLPLALELAAARIKIMSLPMMLQRLADPLTLLTGGARDLPPRQQSLRNALAWSYGLLAPAEQQLFAWLGVFVGGTTLEVVEAVCRNVGDASCALLDGLTALLDNSLLQRLPGGDEPRFVMLATVQEYALECLREAPEYAALQQQHAAFFLALAERAEGETEEDVAWLERCDSELDNFRAALRWALAHAPSIGLRLSGALGRFWFIRGHFTEGRRWLQALLARDPAPTTARAKALASLGTLARNQGDYAAASVAYEEGLSIARMHNDQPSIATLLMRLCVLAFAQSRYADAKAFGEQSLALYRILNDQVNVAESLNRIGAVAFAEGDYDAAQARYTESAALSRKHEHHFSLASVLNNLAEVIQLRGDYATARTLFEESLALKRSINNPAGVAMTLNNIGECVAYQGEMAYARRCYDESIHIRRTLGDKLGVARTLNNLARLAYDEGSLHEAAHLFGETLATFREFDDQRGIALALAGSADVAIQRGELAHATDALTQSLAILETLADRRFMVRPLLSFGAIALAHHDQPAAVGYFCRALQLLVGVRNAHAIAQCVSGLALAAVEAQQWERAVVLAGAIDLLVKESQTLLPLSERTHYERMIAELYTRLDGTMFARCWSQGRALTLDQVIALALRPQLDTDRGW